ncbi:MAG: hypothetical protein ABIN83_03210 [Sphingomicrobium sp.]
MLLIALAALAAEASAPSAPPVRPAVAAAAVSAPPSVADKATRAANQAAQMSMVADMAVKALNRILPPQPDPDPARLALARITMNGFMPAGSYGRMATMMTDNLMTGVYDRLMGMTGTELSNAIGLPIASGADAVMTLRQQASKGDPLFDARIKAYLTAFKEETTATMGIMEPKMREGMARAMARRFDANQLTDLNRFFATDTGQAFGQDMMLLWVDGDVFRGMFAAMPDLMRAMPQSAARFAAIDKQYPWPKKAADKKPAPVKKKK